MKRLSSSALDVLESVVNPLDIALLRLSNHWSLLLSKQLQSWHHSLPLSFRHQHHRRSLVVGVPSAGHALTLHYSKDTVVLLINQYLGASFIHDIVFTVAALPSRPLD